MAIPFTEGNPENVEIQRGEESMNLPQFSENDEGRGEKIPETALFSGTPGEPRASFRLSSAQSSCALSGSDSHDSFRIPP